MTDLPYNLPAKFFNFNPTIEELRDVQNRTIFKINKESRAYDYEAKLKKTTASISDLINGNSLNIFDENNNQYKSVEIDANLKQIILDYAREKEDANLVAANGTEISHSTYDKIVRKITKRGRGRPKKNE